MPASIFCLTLQTRPFLCLIKPDVMHKLTSIVCSFLTGRGQQCKVNDTVSSLVDIGLSIVQGSGIGPTLYIIMKSDLSTLSALNDIFKYADDTTLLVPQHTDTELQQEFNHVRSWAANNHLILNLSKTKEMVFKQPRVQGRLRHINDGANAL